MQLSLEIARKISLAYGAFCKPLCKELGLPQTAFDILMFLGNNPAYKTASDIVDIRHIKANLVSVNVDRLVCDGYIVRQAVKSDRRKTELLCTDKAQPIIEKGRKLQESFFTRLFADMDADTHRAFLGAMRILEKSLDEMLEEKDNP